MNRRDEKEFTKIIQEHHGSLRYFIQSLGVNAAWVDDVAQDAFLIAYRKWGSEREVENPGAWLRTIARNLVQNELAKQNRRKRLLDENLTTLILEAGNTESSIERAADLADQKEALLACIAKLSARARGILESRYVKDRTSGEIGAEFEMKPAAVRKLLFHSRQALASCLKHSLSHP